MCFFGTFCLFDLYIMLFLGVRGLLWYGLLYFWLVLLFGFFLVCCFGSVGLFLFFSIGLLCLAVSKSKNQV